MSAIKEAQAVGFTLAERVLRAESDRVELLGVDRWIGGCHLKPDNLRRWDREHSQLSC